MLVNVGTLVVLRKNVAARIQFFNQIPHSVIEVVRGSEWARLLDAPAEGIVAEGRRAHTRIDNLREPVLEVPGIGFAGGIGEGIAVCVIGMIRHELVIDGLMLKAPVPPEVHVSLVVLHSRICKQDDFVCIHAKLCY